MSRRSNLTNAEGVTLYEKLEQRGFALEDKREKK